MTDRLQDRLALFSWLSGEFGASDLPALRQALRIQREDIAGDARTRYFRVIEGLEGLRVPIDELETYDERIRAYASRLGTTRVAPIRLKYFQYLGALFAEHYLKRLFSDRRGLLESLNAHVDDHNRSVRTSSNRWPSFEPSDLKKVALWMATGSGKTLLMHMNLWQYLYYCPEPERPTNVLLITPNYGLSQQHLRELNLSGISARWFGDAESLTLFDRDPVLVLEITKLVEAKRGGGLTVEVDAFGPRNLLLVDEGHRGATGDRWKELRRRLGEHGFTFEYSATFGQTVNGAAAPARSDLLSEYGKSVLVDYSYAHFYADGFGKDYRVLNVGGSTHDFDTTVVLANALSVLEQRLALLENGQDLAPYNLETPLWVFVGHTVQGTTKDDVATLSDVELVVLFLASVAQDAGATEAHIAAILDGSTGLRDAAGNDIFASSFAYLRRHGWTAAQTYQALLREVFNADGPGALRANVLQRGDGELALGVAHHPYFAVVNVGDLSGLLGLLDARGVPVAADSITPSLFDNINSPASRTNVLIGSRKFMEGWDSFRVASLGIMNIGRGEGSQIVQLFGRGVRLWGRDYSLKRTQEVPSDVDAVALRTLETLGVFGIRADYMQQFREYLQHESAPVQFEIVTFDPRTMELSSLDLRIPVLPVGATFEDSQVVRLGCDDEVSVQLDLRPRVETAVGGGLPDRQRAAAASGDAIGDLRAVADLLDWGRIVADIQDFRVAHELWNLTITPEGVRAVLQRGKLEILVASSLRPRTPADLRRVEGLVSATLRKYTSALYELRRRRWERVNVEMATLTASHPNVSFGGYALKVDTSGGADRLREIAELIKEGRALFEADTVVLPSLAWRNHIYRPLVVVDPVGAVLGVAPPALNDGEAAFVKDVRAYAEALATNTSWRLYLLRNLTRGKGVPFFDPIGGAAFYPDFILWAIDGQRQVVTFVDPHGLRHSVDGFADPRLTLHTHLKNVERQLREDRGETVELSSVIVSTSPYESVRRLFGGATKEEFAKQHVVFREDADYVSSVFGLATALPQRETPTPQPE